MGRELLYFSQVYHAVVRHSDTLRTRAKSSARLAERLAMRLGDAVGKDAFQANVERY